MRSRITNRNGKQTKFVFMAFAIIISGWMICVLYWRRKNNKIARVQHDVQHIRI